MNKYLYGRAVWCSDSLDDYAFDPTHLKLSETKPTNKELVDLVTKIVTSDFELDASEILKIELDYSREHLEEYHTSDRYVYNVELEEEIFQEIIMICLVDY